VHAANLYVTTARLGREKAASIAAVTRWKCRKCSYIYDPRVGDPDGGIPPGTPFERIPDSWRCPVCGATKADFYSLGSPQPAARSAPQPPAAAAESRLPLARPATAAAPTRAGPPSPGVLTGTGWTVGSLKQR